MTTMTQRLTETEKHAILTANMVNTEADKECSLFCVFMRSMFSKRFKGYERWEVFHKHKHDRRELINILEGNNPKYPIYIININKLWENAIIK
jgi:hypothetical protein